MVFSTASTLLRRLRDNDGQLAADARKNGGEITEKTLETVQRISEDRNAERAVSLYLSAYEKLEKQRKACEKRFGALHPDGGSDMEILNRLLGR